MTNFIPIFPLGIVVYPEEKLNLHIFESRYKQLITECYEQQKPFGIPTVIDHKMQDFGSLVRITEITKKYDNGEMDIKTEGMDVFRLLEIIKEIPEKLYSGAIVTYPDNQRQGSDDAMNKLLENIRELHSFLKVSKNFVKPDHLLNTYDVAHHVGFTLQEEYELLMLMDERQRQEYLKRFLSKVLPTVSELEQLKEKIKLNGHFKTLPGFDLKS